MNTKKIMGATLAASLLLVGCGPKETTSNPGKQVDGKYVLASIDEKTFTADDFYDSLINTSNGVNKVYSDIFMKLVEKNCPVNDDMKAELDKLKELNQNYIDNGYETYLLAQIQNSGYNTLDDYYKGYTQYLQIVDFFNQYIEKNYDEIFEDYYQLEAPKKVYHILVKMENAENPTEEEMKKVNEIKELLSLGKDFQETAKNYSDDGSAEKGGYLGICGNSSQFVTEFMDMMNTLEPGKISDPFKTQYGYHFMYIEDMSKEDLKKELNEPDSVLRNWGSSSYYDPYLEYKIFSECDVKYNDETIQQKIEALVSSQLEAREAARKG